MQADNEQLRASLQVYFTSPPCILLRRPFIISAAGGSGSTGSAAAGIGAPRRARSRQVPRRPKGADRRRPSLILSVPHRGPAAIRTTADTNSNHRRFFPPPPVRPPPTRLCRPPPQAFLPPIVHWRRPSLPATPTAGHAAGFPAAPRVLVSHGPPARTSFPAADRPYEHAVRARRNRRREEAERLLEECAWLRQELDSATAAAASAAAAAAAAAVGSVDSLNSAGGTGGDSELGTALADAAEARAEAKVISAPAPSLLFLPPLL